MDPECCRWMDQVEDQQSNWKLTRFASQQKMKNVFQEPNLDIKMTQTQLTRRITQLEKDNFFAEWQTSKDKRQTPKTPKQKGSNSVTAPEEKHLLLENKVQGPMEAIQLLMTPSKKRGVANSTENSVEGKIR